MIHIDTISDRITFLAWRADWRARFAAASERVRESKRELKRIHAARRAGLQSEGPHAWPYLINSLQEDLPYRRRAANVLMIERAEAIGIRDGLLAARSAPPAALAA